MHQHELRRQIVSEMHLRRWPPVPVPGLILQWVTEIDPGDRADELARLDLHSHATGADAHPRHREGTLPGDIRFVWERHSEGSSVALFVPCGEAGAFLAPREDERLAQALAWVDGLPGEILRATAIHTVETEAEAEDIVLRLLLSRSELVSCHLHGKAWIWSDFRIKGDGFGRLLVARNGMDRRDFTRMMQRLQELGNYRNKALLGLPVAQGVWPRLDQAEERLAALSLRVTNAEETDDTLLTELSELSIELMAVAAATNYRLSATAAYSRLVEERLEQLAVSPIEGFSSLVDFTERRFLPAMRTCLAVGERERQLSLRASQLSSLLRARISTRIENQNGRLLRSMERSSTLQLRLQQLVEGLSVVALSYYLIGLIGYALKGGAHWWPGLDPEFALGLLVVPVVALVWFGLHTVKSRVLGEAG